MAMTDAGRVGAERSGREPRRDRQHRVPGREEHERGGPQQRERPREQTRRSAAGRRQARPSPSSRSAAAYGSSRWSATSARTARVASPCVGVEEPRPQPLADDRPDLRLGPGEPRGRRDRLRRARPPDAGPAPRAAPGTPSPVAAVVIRTSGRFGRGRAGRPPTPPPRAGRRARASPGAGPRSAARPGLSPLLTTTRSATSSRPALIAWTSSPISGASRTTVVSAAAATSTSLWPGPDGLDEDQVEAARRRGRPPPRVDVEASPPACPRDAIERMNTSRSSA